MAQQIKNIIVQAGGKGTRLGYLTKNKPKALVPIDNLPMLFHLFKKYPNSKYVIIGDYHYDVLEKYLNAFADVDYQIVSVDGHTGTCSGIRQALTKLPENEPFMLIWSDLILPDSFKDPDKPGNYVGVAKDFPCRWMYKDGRFKEEKSSEYGVAGHFFFENKEVLKDVPFDGELVRWLSTAGIKFKNLDLYNVKEYGLLEEYQKLETSKCRPFNRTYIENGLFVKEAIDEQGRGLAKLEVAWYKRLEGKHFDNIPLIECYEPLKMEFVDGKSIYEYENLPREKKSSILQGIVSCLKSVQMLESAPADYDSFYDAYIGKTIKRLEKVRDLVPFAKDDFITINEKSCRNIFGREDVLKSLMDKYYPKEFKLIHGDCTFSNMMLRSDGDPVLIDPRGYFGITELYGDPAYDWAKVYYSIVGNYDQFNRKRFQLDIRENDVLLNIKSNGWEDMESEFFELLEGEIVPEQIHLIHAIIWLSLTTYAWEDYDSICGAYYNGLLYFEEALSEQLF